MLLPTPPSSLHKRDKDKENNFFKARPSTRSVIWDDELEIHCLSSPVKPLTIPSKARPSAKPSILKKSSQNTLLVPPDTKRRQCTPEPNEILRNESYLTRPLNQIILVQDPNSSESLAALIEGYNVLAARLRSATIESTDGDSDWPLFVPLRQNTEAFVDAVIRDLGRALIDPLSSSPVSEEEMPKFILPSPEKSPTRKKDGMTGEQVKYARDLCTTCHSAIRALSVILALPGFYKFFDEKQLRQIFAALLAIPLADELPTPNARKTRALAIWLIQVQRLPAAVLQPAADRIAYALRRGIDGELGKEGKKGSASDGLKAIYDLCEYLPEVFVPAFVPIVPSVLSNLLANTLSLRTQACHALGGLVLGLTSLPRCSAHTKISSMVASYLTAPGAPTKSDTPTKAMEAPIVRTLRATMSQTDPEQPAQGPVWALSVLASFIVLLNSRLCNDLQANHTLCNLLASGLRHKKSSIRAMTCLAWRCLSWAYLQPPLPVDGEEAFEVDDEKAVILKRAQRKIIMSVFECQTGIANIAALLGDGNSKNSDEPLRLCLQVLKLMAAKSGHSCYDATQTMMQMVSSINGEQDEQDPWDPNLLLPKSFFSTASGLFTTDYKSLTQAIRPLFENLASVGDVRPLTREELTQDWVLAGLMTAWKSALGHLELCDEADMPPELITTWAALLKVNVDHLRDTEDVSAISRLGVTFMKYLTNILEDPDLNLKPDGDLKGVGPANRNNGIPDSDGATPVITGSSTCTNNELRLRVVRRMWNAMKKVFPKAALVEAAEVLLACLMRKQDLLLNESARWALDEEGEQERNSWVTLCVDTLRISGPEAMRVFWGCEEGAPVSKMPGTWSWDWTKEFTNAVWKVAVEKWKDDDGDWESAVILLGVPFTDKLAWSLTSEDFNIWEEFLGYATGNALDHGVDSPTVLDSISSFVSSFQTSGTQPYLSIRLADLLLSHLDMPEMRTVPRGLVEFVSETMRANYPPETKNKAVMRWLARSLMTLVEKCPTDFCVEILQALEDGVALWLSDEYCVWEEDELNYDMIPLYQHILIAIQSFPDPVNVLCAVSEIIGSVFSYKTPSLAVDAFVEFWMASCANVPAPSGGWPEGLLRTLGAVDLLPKADSPKSGSLSPAFNLMASPRTPLSSSYSTSLSVPKRKGIPSPQRPQKVFGKFPTIPTSPVSPTVRRQRRTAMAPRTPLSEIQTREETPCKRRRLDSDGKENLGINKKPLASVAERIADLLKSSGTLLRKRKLDTREEDDEMKNSPTSIFISTPSKRMKERMKPKRTKLTSATRSTLTSPASTTSNQSEKDRRCVEESLIPSALSSPSTYVDRCVGRTVQSKFVYGRTSGLLDAEGQVLGAAQLKKIDFNEILKSRNSIKRSCSTPDAMLNAIERRKRKRLDIDNATDADESGLNTMARRLKRCHVDIPRRTVSMPDCLDSDSTVVESPMVIRRAKHAKLDAGEDMADSDDALPASDDTVASGSSSSSDEDSPTKGAMNRHFQRTNMDSKISRPLLLLL